MPYYGRQPSGQDLQRASGGNPFYNPYSPYPNIGMGIASTFGNIMAMKEMRQQEEYDRGEAEKAYKLKERQIAAQEKNAGATQVTTPTDFQRKVEARQRAYPDETVWDSMSEVSKLGKTETRKSSFMEEVDALVSTGMSRDEAIRNKALSSTPYQQTPAYLEEKKIEKEDKKTEVLRKRDDTRVKSMRTRLERDLNAINTKLDKKLGTGPTTAQKEVLAKEYDNISAVLQIIRNQVVMTASAPLEKSDKVLLDLFQRDYHKIRTGKVLEKFMNLEMVSSHEQPMAGQTTQQTQADIPQEVRDYVAKNPGVTVEQAMGLYQEWLKKK